MPKRESGAANSCQTSNPVHGPSAKGRISCQIANPESGIVAEGWLSDRCMDRCVYGRIDNHEAIGEQEVSRQVNKKRAGKCVRYTETGFFDNDEGVS
jgi:hypothetical protein